MYNAEIGDCIGLESCADIESDVNTAPPRSPWRSRRMEAAETEHPPPIPWLARTGNLPSHMPWVMKRYYTGDGRLIIREEKVRHHEYFQVHRSNGRLVLNLVPLDDNDAVEESCGEHQGVELEEENAVNEFCDEKINGGDEQGVVVSDDPTVGESVSRCYTYNNSLGLGVSTCGGFAAVLPSAFRPPVPT